jgi:hypothetical protein
MKTRMTVTEEAAVTDFRGGPGARRVVCNERTSSDDAAMTGPEGFSAWSR